MDPARSAGWVGFGKLDGIPNLESNPLSQPAVCKSADGEIYFATVKGIFAVDPKKFRINSVVPSVVITEMLVDGKRIMLPETSKDEFNRQEPSSVRIKPGQINYEFRYSALTFANIAKVRFKYKMEGLDKEWSEGGSQHNAIFNHLRPGHYQFHVIACNNDGVWNTDGAFLPFEVLPHFWQTSWFFALSTISFGSIIALTARSLSHQRLKRKMEALNQRNKIELERR